MAAFPRVFAKSRSGRSAQEEMHARHIGLGGAAAILLAAPLAAQAPVPQVPVIAPKGYATIASVLDRLKCDALRLARLNAVPGTQIKIEGTLALQVTNTKIAGAEGGIAIPIGVLTVGASLKNEESAEAVRKLELEFSIDPARPEGQPDICVGDGGKIAVIDKNGAKADKVPNQPLVDLVDVRAVLKDVNHSKPLLTVNTATYSGSFALADKTVGGGSLDFVIVKLGSVELAKGSDFAQSYTLKVTYLAGPPQGVPF